MDCCSSSKLQQLLLFLNDLVINVCNYPAGNRAEGHLTTLSCTEDVWWVTMVIVLLFYKIFWGHLGLINLDFVGWKFTRLQSHLSYINSCTHVLSLSVSEMFAKLIHGFPWIPRGVWPPAKKQFHCFLAWENQQTSPFLRNRRQQRHDRSSMSMVGKVPLGFCFAQTQRDLTATDHRSQERVCFLPEEWRCDRFCSETLTRQAEQKQFATRAEKVW